MLDPGDVTTSSWLAEGVGERDRYSRYANRQLKFRTEMPAWRYVQSVREPGTQTALPNIPSTSPKVGSHKKEQNSKI